MYRMPSMFVYRAQLQSADDAFLASGPVATCELECFKWLTRQEVLQCKINAYLLPTAHPSISAPKLTPLSL